MGISNILKFFKSLISVFVLVFCTTYSGAIHGNPSCSEILSQNENIIWNSFKITEEMDFELRTLQTSTFKGNKLRSVYYDENGPQTVPTVLVCDLNTYKVLAVLGGGNEGTVFLVENEVGNHFALKKFMNKTKMEHNLEIAKQLNKKGARIILPLSIDWQTYTAIYQFIDGVNVSDILRKSSYWELNNLAYPISEETRKFFEDRYTEFVRDHKFYTKLVSVGIIDTNVVFDLNTNQFIIIDPR